MSRFPRSLAALAWLAAPLLLLAAGCGRSRLPAPTSPDGSGAASPLALGRAGNAPAEGAGFYPLDLGDRWHYTGRLTIVETLENGPPTVVLEQSRTVDGEIVCIETRAGRDYFVERRITHAGGVDYVEYLRDREDASGLYEADLPINMAPACVADGAVAVRAGGATRPAAPWLDLGRLPPDRRLRVEAALREVERHLGPIRAMLPIAVASGRPGGVADGEITRLRYPLHRDQHWIIRDDPAAFFESWDDGMTVLETPSGWLPAHRIRVDSNLYSPDEFVELLYGRSGYLGLTVHVPMPETDDSGNVIGVVDYDEVLRLDGLSLAHPGPR